ncbi:MAG: DNA polymerase IV [Spirochaetes bacterium]|nr:DNA polymerase IV [Spirochaetota bacterium]
MTYFHVDLDAFFASVEQQDHPDLRGKPVIVGAKPGTRGVVSACSYEARVYGVRSAMPIAEAVRRCPEGIFLPVRMKRYREVSRQIMEIFSSFTPSWIPISIDEATLDMTGTDTLFGSPEAAATTLKKRVKDTFGLTLSIGIAENRYVAKLASEYRKPDGLYRVLPGEEVPFIDTLGLKKLWGIGVKTLNRLTELGWNTPAKIRDIPLRVIQVRLGKATGEFLYRIVRGIDPGIYTTEVKSHSLSQETTFPIDVGDPKILKQTLLDLSHQVMVRLHQESGRSRTVAIKVRYPNFKTRTFRRTLPHSILSAEELFHLGWELFQHNHPLGSEIRLIGIGLEQVETQEEPLQGELFPREYEKQRSVEKAILELQKKHPSLCLKKASLLFPRINSPGS